MRTTNILFLDHNITSSLVSREESLEKEPFLESSNLPVNSSSEKSNPKFKSRIWKRTEKKPHAKTAHKQRGHVHFHEASSISNDNDSSLDRMSLNSHPPRLYSDVVAFGNEAPAAKKKLSKKKSLHKKRNNFEGFPPLANTSFSDDDHVNVGSKKNEDCETEANNEVNKLDLLRLLNIRVDGFNFTEIDDDPNSASFPRFLRVFEDDDYLKLEQKVLQNFE